MRDFLRGMASINLFPEEREIDFYNMPSIQSFRILSDEEAFKKDLEIVAQDMRNAINTVINK